MKRLLEVAGFVLFVSGASGLVHEVTGWMPRLFGFVRLLPFLEGHEVYTNIVLAVAGVALMAASDRFRRA
ncbi:hypothetical protein [Streptomyces sp. NPDC055287]